VIVLDVHAQPGTWGDRAARRGGGRAPRI